MGIEILGNGKNNLIWGCGNNGKRLLIAFLYFGYKIEGFCDSDRGKQGITVLNNFPVLTVEQALADKEQYNFIISPEQSGEIIEKIKQNGISDYLTIEEVRPFKQHGYMFELPFLHRVIGWNREGNKIVLYGHGEVLYKLKRVLNGLNVPVAYCIDDRMEVENELKDEFRDISELGNENLDYLKVIITNPNDDKISDILEGYGLSYYLNYYNINEQRETINRWCLDSLLGFTRTDSKGNPRSFVRYGEEETDRRIVIIGDSTVDSDLFPFKLWPEILSEKLKKEGLCVTLFEGGVGSYRSSQQLIKLERDVIPLKPNLVIQYCGVIDAVQDLSFSYLGNRYFVHPYQIHLFNKLLTECKMEKKMGGSIMQKTVFYGDENNVSKMERFLYNIRMSAAICKAFDINYKYYLPPILTAKKEYSTSEKEMICNRDISDKILDECYTFWNGMSDKLKELHSVSYRELSEVLNCMDNVFLDHVHITEAGNEIIADIIYNDIVNEKMI